MTTWKNVPAELAARVDVALPVMADVERRKMFGCPAAFVNGTLFMATCSPVCTSSG